MREGWRQSGREIEKEKIPVAEDGWAKNEENQRGKKNVRAVRGKTERRREVSEGETERMREDYKVEREIDTGKKKRVGTREKHRGERQ